MGWLYYKTKDNINGGGIKLSSIGRKIFWLCGVIIYLSTIYISYFKSVPNWLVSLIMSFGKLCFGLYTGSVILVCQQPGHSNLFTRVMGSKVFLFLNKFCFSIYLVAPVIVYAAFGFRTESTQFSEMGSGIDFIAIITLSVGVAFFLVILVEIPFQKLSSRFVMNKR